MNGTQFLKKLRAKHIKKPAVKEEAPVVEPVAEPAPEKPVEKPSKSKKSK